MELDFHYYVTYLIAIKAGFSVQDSYKIAYSSQYIDDNTSNIEVYCSDTKKVIYTNFITQSYNPLNQGPHIDKIYQAFHFLPGQLPKISKRSDGKKHILDTMPYGKTAKRVIRMALKSKNLYWIGIASHAFVDTWAHQNFVGANDQYNSIHGIMPSIIPCIGHSDAVMKPDRIGIVWNDHRLINKRIDNNERFLEAADRLFFEYSQYRDSGASYQRARNSLIHDLKKVFNLRGYKLMTSRIKHELYNELAIKYSRLSIDKYDKRLWLKAALIKHRGNYYWREGNYPLYDWYYFQESAKMYFKHFC